MIAFLIYFLEMQDPVFEKLPQRLCQVREPKKNTLYYQWFITSRSRVLSLQT